MLALAVAAGAQAARAATLKVNTTGDELFSHDGKCSLREAIAAVNSPGRRTACGKAGSRSNTIVLHADRYTLSIAPSGADGNNSGDLNLTARGPLTITGAGTGATVIDARGLGDRVLSVAARASLTLSRLAVTGGDPQPPAPAGAGGSGQSCSAGGAGGSGKDAAIAGAGGGIFNRGTLLLDRVTVTGNHAAPGGAGGAGSSQSATGGCPGGNGGQGASGGGVYSQGSLKLIDTTVQGNGAGVGGPGGPGGGSPVAVGGPGGPGGAGGSGGGIYSRGRLWLTGSTISDNRAGAGAAGGQGGVGGQTPGMQGAGGSGGSGGAIASDHASLGAVNSTLAGNLAGAGGAGGSSGGAGGNGGAIAVMSSRSALRNLTVADNAVGTGGAATVSAAPPGPGGRGGGLFVRSASRADDMRLQNTIVALNRGSGCARSSATAITNAGHDLSYGDQSCPGVRGNPRLGSLQDNGGTTQTIALARGSAAINRVPRKGARCPATDQRGVSRPQENGCDIGAFEFATPTIRLISPIRHASYQRGSQVAARFRCTEGGIFSPIASCNGTVARGRSIKTRHVGRWRFMVTATDKSGNRVTKTIHYGVWKYVNPLKGVSGLTPRRIDLGVDYAGFGPLLALGKARVTTASNTDSGPPSCWAISCWPGGGIVVYRLLEGPFAGKYVYVAEHITVSVKAGQLVRAGQQIATLHSGYPWSEFGWAAGPGPEAMAMADGHRCPCSDPGGWSTIEGRNFDHLLVALGAPSGYLQSVPNQSMPSGWPTYSGPPPRASR